MRRRTSCQAVQEQKEILMLTRRMSLRILSGALAMPFVSRGVLAQAYPNKPVRWVVPFPAGGPTDLVARVMGQWLSERLGQQFVIENRPGGGANIGTEAVVRSAPDGYTLLLVSASHAINATLLEKLNYNFIRDIAPVASIMRTPLVAEVNPGVPVKTVPELIAYAKANPGKINYASGGNGTPNHLTAELFKMMTGVNLQHVPYRGVAPALTDMIGGQVQLMFDSTSTSLDHIKAGKLRPLAVTTAARTELLPDVPTIGESVQGYEASSWYGVGIPKGTSTEIIERLNREINVALNDPQMKARLIGFGGTPMPGNSADFGKLIAEETDKWGKVIRSGNIKPE
jgi:tripartite-type tricarboxylate transporter receptor subunit TctC